MASTTAVPEDKKSTSSLAETAAATSLSPSLDAKAKEIKENEDAKQQVVCGMDTNGTTMTYTTVDLLQVAHRFQISPLVKACGQALVSATHAQNAAHHLALADRYELKKLKTAAIKVLKHEMQQCVTLTSLKGMEVERVLEMASLLRIGGESGSALCRRKRSLEESDSSDAAGQKRQKKVDESQGNKSEVVATV